MSHLLRAATLAMAAAVLVACGSTAPSGPRDGVHRITCDPTANARADDAAVRLLGVSAYTIGGWNHASTASSGLVLPATRYRISGDYFQPDETCGGERTLDLVLVKRLVDWYDQHVNGVESTFRGEDVRFGDVTDITLELRLRPEHTVLPTPDVVAASLSDVLNPEQLAELDTGLVNLELTLFGEGASGDRPFLNAGTIIELDPSQWGEDWVRVRVPFEDLEVYTEENYERTPAELTDHADLLVAGLRINPESAHGNTVRHYILDDFVPGEIPEIFKEMGLAFSLVEIGRTPSASS